MKHTASHVYTKIVRPFIENGLVLDLLDATFGMVVPPKPQNVDLAVTALAELLSSISARGIETSAASKFLWIRQQTPVAIFDRRAETSLIRLGAKLDDSYATYRAKWLKQFDVHEEVIQLACKELVRVRDSSPDDETEKRMRISRP